MCIVFNLKEIKRRIRKHYPEVKSEKEFFRKVSEVTGVSIKSVDEYFDEHTGHFHPELEKLDLYIFNDYSEVVLALPSVERKDPDTDVAYNGEFSYEYINEKFRRAIKFRYKFKYIFYYSPAKKTRK